MSTIEENIRFLKISQLEELSKWREQKFKDPELRTLFLELTRRCNENCLHCGSSCGSKPSPELSVNALKSFLDDIKKNFDIEKMTLAITGGEPLLYKDFFNLMKYASSIGFKWGMTSNGTLITKETADKLLDAGMKSVSISVDGLSSKHDLFRRKPGSYDLAMRGVCNLIDKNAFNVQITTIVTPDTVYDLSDMYNVFSELGIDSWRISNVEPMGRAKENDNLMLSSNEFKYMLDFIKEKRRENIPLVYGCQHYLGLDYEAEVRNWYWFCSAGVYTASITCEGNIVSCLDVEKRPETIQGNIFEDSFVDVWKNRFEFFRQNKADLCDTCRNCSEKRYCMGGPCHSWDYEHNIPLLCFKNVLF